MALRQLYERYADPRQSAPDHDLTAAELRVCSQNGEDGVLAEILRRVTVTANPSFVEFGAERGVEGNCVFLADVLGWSGLFIEADGESYGRLHGKYKLNHRVKTLNRVITPENIESSLDETRVAHEFDVLSIDIDGQDWWVWRAISRYRPRVVIVEYNATLPADALVAVPPGQTHATGQHTSFFGASIAAFSALGEAKGYRLVHTELTGVNAFFVRTDLPGRWPEHVVPRGANYGLRASSHPPDPLRRNLVDITTYLDLVDESDEGRRA